MKRHYVTLKNGSVVHKPKEIGTNQTDTPNIYWSPEQMKLHDFVEVDINFDPISETVDLDSPMVSGETVTYLKAKKQNPEILEISRKRRLEHLQNQADNIILSKYQLTRIIYVALGADNSFGNQMKLDITSVLDSLKEAKTTIENLTSRAQIEAYTHTFPRI